MLIDFDSIQEHLNQLSVHQIILPKYFKFTNLELVSCMSLNEQLNFIVMLNLSTIRNYGEYFIEEIFTDDTITNINTNWDDCLFSVEIELTEPYFFDGSNYTYKYNNIISSNEYIYMQQEKIFKYIKINKIIYFKKLQDAEKNQLENIQIISDIIEENPDKVQELIENLINVIINKINLEHRVFITKKIYREFILLINTNIKKLIKQNKKIILINKDEIFHT